MFAKQGPSEPDLGILEGEIGKGAVLSDPGLACKCTCHDSKQYLKDLVLLVFGKKSQCINMYQFVIH